MGVMQCSQSQGYHLILETNSAAQFRQSQQNGRGGLVACFSVTHAIKLQGANNAKPGLHHTASSSYPLSGVGSLNELNSALQLVKAAKQRPRQFKLAAIHLKQTLQISDTSRI